MTAGSCTSFITEYEKKQKNQINIIFYRTFLLTSSSYSGIFVIMLDFMEERWERR
jgi:hypothetical protein